VNGAGALDRLHGAGLTITVDGGDLLVEPAALLTPDLVALARAHKPELLVLLAPGAWATAYSGLIAPGVCLDCGGRAPRDGMHRCFECRERENAKEGTAK
jgi:hypothetical protein